MSTAIISYRDNRIPMILFSLKNVYQVYHGSFVQEASVTINLLHLWLYSYVCELLS